jgi:hypothetical protein
VQAILDGRKTQTRRICKDIVGCDFENGLDKKPYIGSYKHFTKTESRKWGWVTLENQWLYDLQTAVDGSKTHLLDCPYGKPGDILWVRETWTINDLGDDENGEVIFSYKADDSSITKNVSPELYEKLSEKLEYLEVFGNGSNWLPSIHMPRDAARIFLRVTNVKVERLQDITEDDARAEGVLWERARKINQLETSDSIYDNAKAIFMRLWDSINAKRGYDWDKNPWVWVIEFKRVSL